MTSFILARPWMLLFLAIPLLFLFFNIKKINSSQKMIKQEIYDYYNKENTKKIAKYFRYFTIPWIIGVIALAGPTYQNDQKPLYQNEETWVWVLDMSNSMLADDVKPSRYLQMRYSLMQVLSNTSPIKKIAIVVFAGNAYTLIPPTNDFNTIRTYIRQLEPSQMPMQGSDPFLAIKHAEDLLKDYKTNGNILLITDDISSYEQAMEMSKFINESKNNYFMYVIGSEEGGALKQKNNTLLKDSNNTIVVAKSNLQNIDALAKNSNIKVYSNKNEHELIKMYKISEGKNTANLQDVYDKIDFGFLLIIPLLSLVIIFRKGFIFSFIVASIFVSSMLNSQVVYATDVEGLKFFEEGNFAKAAESFDNLRWKGNSYYMIGEYQRALEFYEKSDEYNSPIVMYNVANCYAFLGDIESAIRFYKLVLETENPHTFDAKYNLDILEKEQLEQFSKTHALSDEEINILSAENNFDNSCNKDSGCNAINPYDLIKNRLANLQRKSSHKTGPAQQW